MFCFQYRVQDRRASRRQAEEEEAKSVARFLVRNLYFVNNIDA